MVARRSAEPVTHPTLGALVETLGPAVVDLVASPAGLDVEVSGVALMDLADGVRVEPGAVLLGVGIRGTDRAAAEIVRTAGEQHAAAVVVKEGSTELQRVATESGVALLVADTQLSWRRLDTLITTALETAPHFSGQTGSVAMGDLFALANAVAAMVGGAIAIEDPQRRVLAYSNLDGQLIDVEREQGILGRQVPNVKGIDELYRQLWSTTGVLRHEANVTSKLGRLAVAVRAGGEVLGSIWAVEGDTLLDSSAEAALADAGRIAALHLLRARNSEDVERRTRAEMLTALLQGHGSAVVAASRLGLPPSTKAVIVAFALVGMPDGGDAAAGAAADRLADLVSVHCEAYRRQATCAAVGPVIYALLPTGDGTRRLDALALDVVTRAGTALGVRVIAAIGPEDVRLEDLPAARVEVERALAVLAVDANGPQVATVDEVREQTILMQIGAMLDGRPDLELASLREMRETDEEKGTAHVATLRAYFDSLGDVIAAAERLSVHQNTFRYRLRRVGEVFGIDMTDPDTRLLLWLQLRLLDRP